MRVLRELRDFGDPAAESETVENYFLKTPAYDDVYSLKKAIVLGPKGSGKTALYKILSSLDVPHEGLFATGLTFRDYPWVLHESVGNTVGSKQERYVDSWMFLIAIELAIRILKHRKIGDLDREAGSAYNNIEKFLRENYGKLDPDHKDIYRPQKFKLFWKFGPQVAGATLGDVSGELIDKTTFANRLHEITRSLYQDLSRLMNDDEIHLVLFDELDLGIDMKDPAYTLRIIGLLLAAKYVREWADKSKLSVAAIVFLRTDIFRGLSFSDKNKLVTPYVVRLEWSTDHEQAKSLKSLLDTRIRSLLDLPESVENPWEVAFDEENKMRGNQHKCDFIAARSMLRPRNFIKFANLALEEFHNRTDREETPGRIRSEDMVAARARYSAWLVDELDDELAAHLPAWKRLLEPIRRIGILRFSVLEYEKHYKELGLEKAISMDYLGALEFLYRFGIIGFQKVGGGGGGSKWYWSSSAEDVNLDPGAKNFQVYLGLKEVLELKEPRAGSTEVEGALEVPK